MTQAQRLEAVQEWLGRLEQNPIQVNRPIHVEDEMLHLPQASS
jgi:hypothetical protein